MAKKQSIAQAKYDAANCKGYHLKLVYKTDQDIIDKLSSVPSMQGYIKALIRADIARTGSAPENSTPVPEKTDSAPVSYRDPLADVVANAVHSWHEKSTSILTDKPIYTVTDSAPDSDK